MPVDVRTEIEINRQRVDVAEFASDPDNAPRWYENIDSVEWETSGLLGGTRMTLRNRGEPSGFGKVGAPIMAKAMRRANRNDLARLKHILESGPDG